MGHLEWEYVSKLGYNKNWAQFENCLELIKQSFSKKIYEQ